MNNERDLTTKKRSQYLDFGIWEVAQAILEKNAENDEEIIKRAVFIKVKENQNYFWNEFCNRFGPIRKMTKKYILNIYTSK